MVASLVELDGLAWSIRGAGERVAAPLARSAAAFSEKRGWFDFGYARAEDHARERFGRTGRWLRDLAVLGRALDRLPLLARALDGRDGERPLGRVAATAIARVCDTETVGAWVDLARAVTVRELRAAVRDARDRGLSRPAAAEHERPPGPLREAERFTDVEPASGQLGDVGSGLPPGDDRDNGDRHLVSMAVPRAVLASFRESVELHRAVSGYDATVTSFVEALVAEAQAGPRPPDVAAVPLRRQASQAVVEQVLARSTRGWEHLRWSPGERPGESATDVRGAVAMGRGVQGDACGAAAANRGVQGDALGAAAVDRGGQGVGVGALALDALEQFETLVHAAGTGRSADLDRQIRSLIELEDRLEIQLGRLLCEIGDRGGFSRLGFAGLRHYAEQRLGLGRTSTQQRSWLERALRRFPRLREAYENREIGRESAKALITILGSGRTDARTESAWLRRARQATVKRLRDEARAWSRRSVDPRERGRAAVPLTDAEWHASLGHQAGQIRKRVHAWNRSLVSDPQADSRLCLRVPVELARDFVATVVASVEALAEQVETVPWDAPWPDSRAPASVLIARMFSVRCRRVPSWVGLLAMLENYVDTWDAERAVPRRRSEAVYAREGWRCFAPGCSSRRNLEDHHVLYRSRGGDRLDLSNRVCLCRFHHVRGEHGELASCRGIAPLHLTWRLGRRGLGVLYRNERRLGAFRPSRRASNGPARDAQRSEPFSLGSASGT